MLLSSYFFGLQELSYTKMSRILLSDPNCVSPSGKQRGYYTYSEFRADNVAVSSDRITAKRVGTYVACILKLSETFVSLRIRSFLRQFLQEHPVVIF